MATDEPLGLPPDVEDLVKLVGRLFYRDEYIVVLDYLASNIFLRDDDIERIFLLPRGPRKVLGDLINECLVCSEDINERIRSIRDVRHDTINQVTAVEGRDEKRPPRLKSKKRSLGDEDDEEGNSDDDDDEATKLTRRHGVKTTVYYINPRYFVDVVKYRVYLMRRHLESFQKEVDSDNSYKCSNISRCGISYRITDAMQATATIREAIEQYRLSSPRGPPGTFMMRGRKCQLDASVGEADFICPHCFFRLTDDRRNWLSGQAGNLLGLMQSHLNATGLHGAISRLDKVPLGPNRPSDHIRNERLTLQDPDVDRLTASGTKGTGSTGDDLEDENPLALAHRGRGKARIYIKERREISVEMSSGGAGGSGKRNNYSNYMPNDPALQAKASVNMETLPELLKKSGFTGEATSTFGFVRDGYNNEFNANNGNADSQNGNGFGYSSNVNNNSNSGNIYSSGMNQYSQAGDNRNDDDYTSNQWLGHDADINAGEHANQNKVNLNQLALDAQKAQMEQEQVENKEMWAALMESIENADNALIALEAKASNPVVESVSTSTEPSVNPPLDDEDEWDEL